MVGLGDMNGREVLQRLKSNPATARPPVIVVTSSACSSPERDGSALSAASIVSKDSLNSEVIRECGFATPEVPSSRAVGNQRRGKVLVVDDHEASLYWRRNVLADAGHTVFEARSLGEAMVVVQEFRAKLIVLNVNLPDGNGMEFCRT